MHFIYSKIRASLEKKKGERGIFGEESGQFRLKANVVNTIIIVVYSHLKVECILCFKIMLEYYNDSY